MKPTGPIPPGFADSDGALAVNGCGGEALAALAGDTPCFVYSAARIRASVASLRAAMPASLSIHYAMKANPYPPLLSLMCDLVDGFDIASAGELSLALAAGMDPMTISFAGPGKRDRELAAAIAAGVTLNLESEGEAQRALAIGEHLGRAPRLAVRVNPDFDLKGSGMRMGGGAKPFGIDAERVPALVRALIDSGAEWQGFHIYAGSQAIDADAIIESQSATIRLVAELADAVGAEPPHVNLGGGFGIPYFPGETPLDIAKVGAALGTALDQRPDILANTGFAIELGRWLVGEAGIYLTRIIDRKISHGQLFLVTDGGLHHQLAASGNFGTVIRRNYPVALARDLIGQGDKAESEIATVVGCLCTPIDRLADQISLPRAEIGDLIVIFCAGAYGATASPADFLGHGKAVELLI